MKNRTVAGCCSFGLAVLLSGSACAAGSGDNGMGNSLGTNTRYGEAMRTSGSPGYHIVAEAPKATAEVVPVVAPEPVEVVVEEVVLAPAPVDRCAPVALSAGAVGQPCLTTDAFIRTLGLSSKNQARAISMVARAEQSLAH